MNFTTIIKAASRAGLAGVLALGLSAGFVPGAQADTVIRDNHARVVLTFPPYFTLNGFPVYGFYGEPSYHDYTSIPQPDYYIRPSPGAGDYAPHFYSHEQSNPNFFGR